MIRPFVSKISRFFSFSKTWLLKFHICTTTSWLKSQNLDKYDISHSFKKVSLIFFNSAVSYVYILHLHYILWTKVHWKMINFARFFLNNWSLRSNSVTRQVNFNRTKIGGKYQNPNATFCVILKHCAIPELQENRVFMLGHKGHVFLKEEKKKAQFHNFFSIF